MRPYSKGSFASLKETNHGKSYFTDIFGTLKSSGDSVDYSLSIENPNVYCVD